MMIVKVRMILLTLFGTPMKLWPSSEPAPQPIGLWLAVSSTACRSASSPYIEVSLYNYKIVGTLNSE